MEGSKTMTTNKLCWALSALVLILAVYASNAKAETYVYAGAWSQHFGTDQTYNERHDLLAVEHKGIMAGYFKNSYSHDTVFAGYRFTRQWGDFEGGLLVGAMRGYNDCIKGNVPGESTKVCPMAAPSITYTAHKVQPSVLFLGNAVAISFRIDI